MGVGMMMTCKCLTASMFAPKKQGVPSLLRPLPVFYLLFCMALFPTIYAQYTNHQKPCRRLP